MKRLFGVFLLSHCLAGSGFAQDSFGVLQGRIEDSKTRRSLNGANVTLAGTRWGDATDAAGFFKIEKIPPGQYEMVVTMIGYQTHRQRLRMAAGDTLTLSVKLDSTVLKGPEIKVEEERIEDRSLQITPPTFKVQQHELRLMPGTLDDILPVLHTLPGVLPLSDYSTQFIVHGGSPNQNLILVDGIELINPYRRSGMASLFNPVLVQDVNLYNRKNVFYYRNIIKIEDEFARFPPSLQFPKPVLYREPVYMLPFIPSFGFGLAF
jgi:hypothetical protein